MKMQERNKDLLPGEEEDHSWPGNELLYKATEKESRSFVGLLILVTECFIPDMLLRQFRKAVVKSK
ncbi:MAG: hypothetical protein KF746_04700 [Chitinophagaceae bacterium]|nr:hypothetical protein [Chitinophagaceae bacterium]